jgi:ubiquinone/menaquinone biosynthesis C-methylase UbiE
VRWATLGRDAAWKRALLQRLGRGGDVIDYACGTGLLSIAAAQRGARVVGVDLSAGMLAEARAKAAAARLEVRFVQADAESWAPPARAFDAVVAGYLPKYVAMDRWLPHAARALRPGGLLLAYDFTYPANLAARAAWEAWWRRLGPRLATQPAWGEVAAELPALIRRTRWLPAMQAALPRHGFSGVRVRALTFGAAALVEATRIEPSALPQAS